MKAEEEIRAAIVAHKAEWAALRSTHLGPVEENYSAHLAGGIIALEWALGDCHRGSFLPFSAMGAAVSVLQRHASISAGEKASG